MAFLDSFDDRSTAEIGSKYAVYIPPVSPLSIAIGAFGRNGTKGIRLTRGSSAATVSAEAYASVSPGVRYKMAFARRWSTLPPSGSYRSIAAMRDGGTTQCELRQYDDGIIRTYRNGVLVPGAVSSMAFLVNVYYHFEWDLLVDPAAGVTELRVNGSTVAFAVTGQNTRTSASSNIDRVGWRTIPSNSSDSNWIDEIDDVVIHNSVGFCGDLRIGYFPPTGAGTYTQWPGTGAATPHEAIDDLVPDGNTTYVSSGTIGDKQSFPIGDVPVTATIKFAQHVIVAQKTDAGPRTIAPKVVSGATEQNGSVFSLTTDYVTYLQPIDNDPNTGAVWTPAGFNAAEIGDEVIS